MLALPKSCSFSSMTTSASTMTTAERARQAQVAARATGPAAGKPGFRPDQNTAWDFIAVNTIKQVNPGILGSGGALPYLTWAREI
jgi:hypothetical protein